MKIIALTMRADLFESYEEERYSIDPRWFHFLKQFKCRVILLPNDISMTKLLLDLCKIDLIILSGGGNPQTPETEGDKNRLHLEEYLIKQSIISYIPIVGICRGAQSLIYQQGGKLTRSLKHAGKKHKIYFKSENYFNLTVNSYHNFIIESQNLPSNFHCFAFDDDKNVEAAVHNIFPWVALMWHPERDYHNIDQLLFNTVLNFSKLNKSLKAMLLENIGKWKN